MFQAVTLGVPGAIANDPDTAARFSLSQSAVIVGDALDIVGAVAFTFEAWARPTATERDFRSGTKAPSASASRRTRPARGREGFTPQGLATGTYSHVVVSYDGATLRFFVNGKMVAESVAGIRLNGNAADFVIGSLSAANGNTWIGDLDEIAVYDHELSAARVGVHYAHRIGP